MQRGSQLNVNADTFRCTRNAFLATGPSLQTLRTRNRRQPRKPRPRPRPRPRQAKPWRKMRSLPRWHQPPHLMQRPQQSRCGKLLAASPCTHHFAKRPLIAAAHTVEKTPLIYFCT
jgi:hypothetical protein